MPSPTRRQSSVFATLGPFECAPAKQLARGKRPAQICQRISFQGIITKDGLPIRVFNALDDADNSVRIK